MSEIWGDSDRLAPTPSLEDERLAKSTRMHDDMFKATSGTFSLGDELIEDLRRRKREYSTPGLTAYFQAAAATHCLVTARTTKD